MASEKGMVHVIDDDEALRESLVFLLRTARIDVESYASASAFFDAPPDPRLELCDYRRPHAGNERHRPAAAVARTQNQRAGRSSSPVTATSRSRSKP